MISLYWNLSSLDLDLEWGFQEMTQISSKVRPSPRRRFQFLMRRNFFAVSKYLKPSQNKKGRKNIQLHRLLNTFSQLLAVKKYSKNGAAGNVFGPSYFDPALEVLQESSVQRIFDYHKNKYHFI